VEEGGFRMAMIVIVDQSTMLPVSVTSTGKDEELLVAIKNVMSSSEGMQTTLVARAIREKNAVISNDTQNDPRLLFGNHYSAAGVNSMTVLPLIIEGEAVGALALYASEIDFFQIDEMKLLTELADDIAFAIDHIEKQERLHYLAYYDPLTGLANRSLFFDRAAQYIYSAINNGRKLAIGLIDLERFKKYQRQPRPASRRLSVEADVGVADTVREGRQPVGAYRRGPFCLCGTGSKVRWQPSEAGREADGHFSGALVLFE